ncbi:hypothetical protein ACEI28_004221 [Vibrio alginolyticus]
MINAKSRILCVFEGAKREVGYFHSMTSHFFSESDIVHCCYGNDLYELARLLTRDGNDPDDFDIFEVIKEHNTVKENEKLFTKYTRDDFNQVYLFFDFEYHDDKYNEDDIKNLIEIFNEETEVGKLFISYPMVEAIRDIPSYELFVDYSIELDEAKSNVYKTSSSEKIQDFVHAKKITKAQWNSLVMASVSKANYLVNADKHKETIVEQSCILNSQLTSINKNNRIFVLSAYPMFLHNQFDIESFK